MRCAKCGVENREGRKFCAQCAAAMAARCTRCGASNEPGEKFCGACGAPLTASSSQALSTATAGAAIRVAGEEPNASPPVEGERKTVTALFADIKRSMDLMEDLDPEEARAIVDPALKLMMDAAHRYDGYIMQSTGDGIFAIFGAPGAHEDYPQRALSAALRMQEDLKRYADKCHEAGIALIQGRLAAQRATGVELWQPYFSCLLAEAYMETGCLDDGLSALTEALAAADKHGDRHNQAEIHRLKGELLLKQDDSKVAEAQSCFERAIEIAREQSAKSWELRATMSLARLFKQQGETDEARQMLAEIYGWFTEGFDTADLKDAKALLDQLNG